MPMAMASERDGWLSDDRNPRSATSIDDDQTCAASAPQVSPTVRIDTAGCREALLRLLGDLDDRCGGMPSSATAEEQERLAAPPADMQVQVRAALQGAAEIGALLTVKAPPLRHQAAQLAQELSDLNTEAGQQAAMAEQCIDELMLRAEALRSQVKEANKESSQRAEAACHRQAILQEEVRVLEQRAKAGTLAGATNGPTWASVDAEKRKKLEARIVGAEQRQAAATKVAQETKRRCEDRLAALREERQELEASAGTADVCMWRSRFEALLAAQNALADRAATLGPDSGRERLDQALAAASSAVAAAGGGPACREGQSNAAPEYLLETVRCVCGLAEAERRRGGLLMERWRELHGHDSFRMADSKACGSVAPGDRGFSPSRAYDWDLDMWRTTQKAGGE